MLLMEAVRSMDETRDRVSSAPAQPKAATRKVLVIDDSLMLLSFVKEILTEANYEAVTAATAEEGLTAAASDPPDLILLDYVLPDMKGDEVCQRLTDNAVTASVPIVYMSGFGSDLQPDQIKNANVIGSLNKPFTSDLLIKRWKIAARFGPRTRRPSQRKKPDGRKADLSFRRKRAGPVWPQDETPQAESQPVTAERTGWWIRQNHGATPPSSRIASAALSSDAGGARP